jgi:hypothetical protein
MKLFMLLLLPAFTFAQDKLDTITFLSGKVKILSPTTLSVMSEQIWNIKYQNRKRPVLALSDKDGEVNLLADLTQQQATAAQLGSFKDFQISQLKKSHPDIEVLSDGTKTVNSKKIGYIKFLTQAIDQKVFNYYFFTIVEGKILMFTFNCIEKLQKTWEPAADRIVSSLITK